MAELRLTTILIDDEPPARDLLRLLCADHEVVVLGEAGDGASALALLERMTPDFLLLDIAMPVMDGMTVARRLFGLAQAPKIVFTTAFAQYAVAAFDVAAADYLLKPVDPSRFAVALERVRAMRIDPAVSSIEYLWVPHRSDLLRIGIDAIERVEAERDYVRLHVTGRSHLLRETMDRFQSRLPQKDFLRVHRSTIVRRDLISGLRHEGSGVWSALLHDGATQRIGRSYLDAVRSAATERSDTKRTSAFHLI